MSDLRKFTDLWKKMMYVLSSSQKRWGIVVFILSFFGSLAELLGVSVIIPLAQVMIEPEKLRANQYVSPICDALGINTNQSLLILITGGVIFLYVVKNVFLSFLAWIRVRYSTRIERELSVRMVKSYVRRGYPFLKSTDYAYLVRGCDTSVIAIQQIINCFFRIVLDSFTLVLIFVFIAVTDFTMAIALTGVALVTLLFVTVVFRKAVNRAGRVYFERVSITSKWFRELFYGIKEILVMNKVPFFVHNYEDSYSKQQEASITQNLAQTYPTYFIEAMCMTGLMATVCVRMLSMDNPESYVAQLAAFAVAAFRVLPCISRISSTFSYFLFQIPSANDVYENMREAAEYPYQEIPQADEDKDAAVFSDRIEIDDLSFMYPDSQEYVLRNISLTIKRGDAVAFVGPSGAGKSTLADVILGLYHPQSGEVRMDGMKVLEHRAMWARNAGYVPQSVYLIDDSVRRNIAFGCSDEEIDDDRVWASLEQAQMKDYIEGLPDGLNTIVGERGVRFSGGQAQRLAIARALYNDPQILILDEATSALDNTTEHAIMDAINMLQGHKTLIIIAHRLTTVQNCDHIYEIKDGMITEKTYSELK